MTYPKCAIEPLDALAKIRACHPAQIKDYVIAQENHEDGSKHLHAFIRYDKRVSWSPKLWDIDGHHGNYQQAKSWKNVIAYCTKDGNYISNIDVESAASKKAARNKQLIEEDPKQLVDSGTIGLLQLPSLMKAKAAYSLAVPPLRVDNVRGFWVTGKTGSGKTHLARTKAEGSFYLKKQNKWFDGYSGQKHIILDDFDHQGAFLSHEIKLWADRFECTGEIKGGTISLVHEVFWITSQYTIDEIWPLPEQQELRDAIRRRFRIIKVANRMVTETIENELPREDN